MAKPFPIRVGMDEVATGSQQCDGFTFLGLPEAYVDEFTTESRKLLVASGLHAFHGKKCKDQDRSAFSDFLTLSHEFLRRSPQTFAACRLFSKATKANLAESSTRVVDGTIEKALGADHPAAGRLRPYFFPLAALAAVSRELAPSVEMRIDMDEHSSFGDLSAVAHAVGGTPVRGATLLKGLYNGYAKSLHDRTPLLPDDGVKVMRDTKSMLIQAADVIGHFAINYVFLRLGTTSKNKLIRGQIFVETFGADAEAFDPTGKITLAGDDFALAVDGSLTLKIAWVVTTPPKDASLMKDWPQDDGFLGTSDNAKA